MPLRRALALLICLQAWSFAAEGQGQGIEQQVAEALKDTPATAFALRSLRELIDSATPPQRVQILAFLERARRVDARVEVLRLVSDGNADVVRSAVMTLRAFGPSTSEDNRVIDAALLNGDELVRRAAISCIISWHDVSHVPALADRLTGETPKVHDEAAAALTAITGKDFGDDARAWKDWYRQHEETSRRRLDKASEDLRSADGKVVAAAITDLIQDTEHRAQVVELIKPLTKDADARVAAAAIAGLRAVAPQELIGIEDVKAPAEKPIGPRTAAAKPPAASGGFPWGAILGAIVLFALGAWWVRRLIAGTRGPSVAEVVARAQLEQGIGSERSARAVRPSAKSSPVVAGVKPDAAAKLAAARAAGAKKSAKSDVEVGKRGEKIFKLD